MEESPSYLEIGSHPIRHSIWSEILCRGDLKTMLEPERQTLGLRSGLAATGDLPTIAFFRAGPLLRRNGPVPGILISVSQPPGPGRLQLYKAIIALQSRDIFQPAQGSCAGSIGNNLTPAIESIENCGSGVSKI